MIKYLLYNNNFARIFSATILSLLVNKFSLLICKWNQRIDYYLYNVKVNVFFFCYFGLCVEMIEKWLSVFSMQNVHEACIFEQIISRSSVRLSVNLCVKLPNALGNNLQINKPKEWTGGKWFVCQKPGWEWKIKDLFYLILINPLNIMDCVFNRERKKNASSWKLNSEINCVLKPFFDEFFTI